MPHNKQNSRCRLLNKKTIALSQISTSTAEFLQVLKDAPQITKGGQARFYELLEQFKVNSVPVAYIKGEGAFVASSSVLESGATPLPYIKGDFDGEMTHTPPVEYQFNVAAGEKPKFVFHVADQYGADVGNHFLRFLREILSNYPEAPISVIYYKAQGASYPAPQLHTADADQQHLVLISGSNRDVGTTGLNYGIEWIDFFATDVMPAILKENESRLTAEARDSGNASPVQIFATCSGQQVVGVAMGGGVEHNHQLKLVSEFYGDTAMTVFERKVTDAHPQDKTLYFGGLREMTLVEESFLKGLVLPAGTTLSEYRVAVSHVYQMVSDEITTGLERYGLTYKLAASREDCLTEICVGTDKTGKPVVITSQNHPEKRILEIFTDQLFKMVDSGPKGIGITPIEKERLIQSYLEVINKDRAADKQFNKVDMLDMISHWEGIRNNPEQSIPEEEKAKEAMEYLINTDIGKALQAAEKWNLGPILLRHFLTQ